MNMSNPPSKKIFLEGIFAIPTIRDDFAMAEIRECIFFCDYGKTNVSGLKPVANGDDIELERWK